MIISKEEQERIVDKLNDEKASFRFLQTKKKDLDTLLYSLEIEEVNTKEARSFLQVIAEETLKNLEFHLSTLPTSALFAIDPSSPKQIAEITTKRNQVECCFYFDEEGNLDKPIDSAGGGLLGIAGFGNRIMMWSLNPNSPVLTLDEPFKDLSSDKHKNASELLQKLTKEIGLQIIMVSHQEEIHAQADKIFKVTKKGKESIVTVV